VLLERSRFFTAFPSEALLRDRFIGLNPSRAIPFHGKWI
jgi:hypothetical protein